MEVCPAAVVSWAGVWGCSRLEWWVSVKLMRIVWLSWQRSQEADYHLEVLERNEEET